MGIFLKEGYDYIQHMKYVYAKIKRMSILIIIGVVPSRNMALFSYCPSGSHRFANLWCLLRVVFSFLWGGGVQSLEKGCETGV